jgi:hypothetical protein
MWSAAAFLSIMPTPAENLRHGIARARGRSLGRRPHGHLVRIIEYTITIETSDGRTRTEPFRLATTLPDHVRAPAAEIAAIYHERWEIENGYGELKTLLRGAAFILRSKLPELVCQELFALLTVYQALCTLKCEAALAVGIDPDRVSFIVTLRVARDHTVSALTEHAQARRTLSATFSTTCFHDVETVSASASRNRPRTPSRPRSVTLRNRPPRPATRSRS